MSKQLKLAPIQILAVGFGIIILIGAMLLCLPIANKTGEFLPFINGFFTATSATCVTGLAVYDTFSQFTFFGQLIILILIQIGGLGFIALITIFAFTRRSEIGLFRRSLIMESIGTFRLSGVVKIVKRMLIGTLVIESAGAALLATQFIPLFGFARGMWFSIFHSISAFCNAGFDLMGILEPYSSLTHFVTNPVVNLTIVALIIVGGIGFFVWSDIADNKLHFSKYLLHSKIIITGTFGLIIISTIILLLLEWNNTLSGFSFSEKLVSSLFHAVTPRTAGFNTLDINSLTPASRMFTMILMFIGAGSGSTAGGIKVTTFVVIILSIISYSKNYIDLEIFGRRLESTITRRAFCTVSFYTMSMILGAFLLLCFTPGLGFGRGMFEVVSAIGTVGLSTGITPTLPVASKFVLIVLMYIGRVGSLTVAMAIARKKIVPNIKFPVEKITIG